MARRRQEIALQTEIETQEEWNENINKEGLTVIDIYQQWAGPCRSAEGYFKKIKSETDEPLLRFAISYGGPCKALEPKFRAIKNTLGDPLLAFAIAKADTIDSLEKYRNKCEPCFLFYASGVLVDSVIGANAPALQRKISSNLEQEKKVLKEGGQRIEHRVQYAEVEEEDDDDAGGAKRKRSPSIVNAIASHQYTLATIRPDAYADGKVDEIIQKIVPHGFRVLLQEEHNLTEHDARQFHRHRMNEEGYEDHIKHMTSGPSIVLLLQKTDAKEASLDEFRELVNSDQLLKETVDCTQSADNVQQDLMLLLPNVAQKPQSAREKEIERTLALVRPSALKLYKDAIVKRIQESGFSVTRTAEVQLTQAQAEQFYAEKKNEPFYQDLIKEMTSGPSLALYLTKKDAIQGFRTLLGPADKARIKEATGTFRHDFDIVDAKINSLHAPGSRTEVNRNLQFFFPEERILVVLKPGLTDQQRAEIVDAFRKAHFFVMARKTLTLTQEQATKLQHAHHGKEYYDELIHYMTSAPSELLVLVKEDASKSWHEVVGPEEPAKASETAPTSLRAMYGKDLVHNAVDISPNVQQAKDDIHMIFGDLDKEEHA
ncbi:unnamed protein product [Adineta ricciae]|uniref:Nucleoside diphosphate kinase-like domain-containing protein n=1 Tax=Adineta ricciae TaxID=249248 RepID=A0A814UT75_ADIRI|nr:unnamed protein product [Adineta ricciae]